MNTLPASRYELRAISHEMTSNRELYQMAHPGILLRSLMGRLRGLGESIAAVVSTSVDRTFGFAAEEAYCTFRPVECKSLA